MATHEELVVELPKLDKLSNAARLKHAKKRRLKQLKRYQEYVRQQRALASTPSTAGVSGGNIMRRRKAPRIAFEDGSILSDMVSRNELMEGTLFLRTATCVCVCVYASLNTVECGRVPSSWRWMAEEPGGMVTARFQGRDGCGRSHETWI